LPKCGSPASFPAGLGHFGGKGGTMTKTSVVRGIVASMFAISTAAAGLALGTTAAGASEPPPPNCEVTPQPAVQTLTPQPEPAHCATLKVTKVVTGSPAPGTTFNVGVDCEVVKEPPMSPDGAGADALPPGQNPPFTTTLTFPAQGGTQDVFIASESECTVTETPPPGCTLTSIDPEKTAVNAPVEFPVTVTNDCPPPPPQAAAPAQPAAAVVVVPRFTG
jgi:hypothetical protein